MGMTLVSETSTKDSSEVERSYRGLSVAEIDDKLEQAVEENERSERLICDLLLEMGDRRGYEKFGFSDIYYYAEARFGFSPRKTRYLLRLARQLRRLPRIKKALAEGRLGWTKVSRIARVASEEDETMWLDSALSLSVRELDRKINEDRDVIGVKVRAWLTKDQSAVLDNAVEVCRRLAGEDLDIGRCLEFMAGEFLATYAYLAYRKEDAEDKECGEEVGAASEQAAEDSLSEDKAAAAELHICPENDDLPWPTVVDYGKTWRAVLERDEYRCGYPDCGARDQLHVHHIQFRSRSGSKGRAKSNSPQNLLTLCVFHHRMLHGGTIGVVGTAPSQLEWRRPALMENALRRYGTGTLGLKGDLVREPRLEYESPRRSGKGRPSLTDRFGKRFPEPDLGRKVTFRVRGGLGSVAHSGKFMRPTRSWKRGSSRSGSHTGSTVS